PNYYNLGGITATHLSDHLSELVEITLEGLANSHCITIDDDTQVAPANLGRIAAYYNISCTTIETFSSALQATTKLQGLLEILCAAAEFEDLAVRHHEEGVLRRIAHHVPYKLHNERFDLPLAKCHVLIQAHFSRLQLPPDLASDQARILGKMIPLIQATVDIVSTEAWLKPALAAMELSQMVVQSQWESEPVLRQVPHFSKPVVKRAQSLGVNSVFEIAEMDDEQRQALFAGLNPRQVADVADFVNHYPEIDLQFELTDGNTLVAGGNPPAVRDIGPVIARYFPFTKPEGWWAVLGDTGTQTLAAIRRVGFQQRLNLKLGFTAPDQPGDYTYKLFLMSDAYLGCDQEYEVKFLVVPDDEADSESEAESNGSENSE
ncbi:U5 small nuclear ribonucleo protein 200 kDa helicase, partial [Dimargaris cristalligena]